MIEEPTWLDYSKGIPSEEWYEAISSGDVEWLSEDCPEDAKVEFNDFVNTVLKENYERVQRGERPIDF